MIAVHYFPGRSDFQVVHAVNNQTPLLIEKDKNRLLRILSYSNQIANKHERTIQDESPIKSNY